MLTVGVDLAAEAARTAVAWVDWSPAGATVPSLILGADDDTVVAAIVGAGKAGIDCPFGWPGEFADFLAAHRDGHVSVPDGVAGRDWRRRLALRITDLAAHELTGLRPMSVSADRIGHTAMRCAGLLARLAREGQPVDRSGGGVVVEVYPAASLKQWNLPYHRYKRTAHTANRNALVDALLSAAPWLRPGRHELACRRSDDALDAVIAALTARAAFLGLVHTPDESQAQAARTERWIAIPNSPISELTPRRRQ